MNNNNIWGPPAWTFPYNTFNYPNNPSNKINKIIIIF